MKLIILPCICVLLFFSCNTDLTITNPVIDSENFLSETTPLPAGSKLIMEGIYDVVQGQDLLGDQVVVKWTRDRLSVFSGNNGIYIILDGGSLDSVLFFLGHWRRSTNTETGKANFYMSSDEGGKEVLKGDTTATNMIFTGSYGNENEATSKKIVAKYRRPFSSEVKQSDFHILAHRGGGRNSDLLGPSENSIEMINIAERFGATGVEIDARLSKDGIPFLYHDNDINLRLTQKGLIWGKIEDFTWQQLKTLITLRNGERIPSLREALEFILGNTNLRIVWLDTKDVDVLDEAIKLQQEIINRAAAMGRDLKIFIGIPADDIYQEFIKYPGHENVPSLCELSIENVRESDADIWAPRWTMGTQTSNVDLMHAEGRKAFVWTLDEETYIQEFINGSEFDGVLSNYPATVAYYHYIKE